MCPTCNSNLEIRIFPALLGKPETVLPTAIAEGEASCYNHVTRQAVASCANCGRFVCALCQIEFDGTTRCPTCLERTSFEKQRILYDSIALATATLPAVFIWTTIVGAPLAIYTSLRYWKRPSSLVPRNKWRFVLAILIALLELIALAALAIAAL